MSGSKMYAVKIPPAKMQAVANIDVHCRSEMPVMECPLTHPPAYRLPKPIRNPPNSMMIIPGIVCNAVKEKS